MNSPTTAAAEAVRAERYRNGDCPECGAPLCDEDLAAGFDYCGGDVCAEFLV